MEPLKISREEFPHSSRVVEGMQIIIPKCELCLTDNRGNVIIKLHKRVLPIDG